MISPTPRIRTQWTKTIGFVYVCFLIVFLFGISWIIIGCVPPSNYSQGGQAASVLEENESGLNTVSSSTGNNTVLEQQIRQAEQKLKTAREENEPNKLSSVLLDVGILVARKGLYQSALAHFREALENAQTANDRVNQAEAHNRMGLVYHNLRDYEKALTEYQLALQLWKKLETENGSELSTSSMAQVLNNIALINLNVGRPGDALIQFQQALALVEQAGDRVSKGRILSNIGAAYSELGEHETALNFYQQALTIAQSVGDLVGVETKGGNIGVELGKLEEHESAIEQFIAVAQGSRIVGNPAGEWTAYYNLGIEYETVKQPDRAINAYISAIDIFEALQGEIQIEGLAISFAERQANLYSRLISLLAQSGKSEQAFNYAERARARTFLNQLGNQPIRVSSGADSERMDQEQQMRQELIGLQNTLALEQAKASSKLDQELLETLKTQVEQLRQEHAKLLDELKASDPQYTALIQVDTLTANEVQSQVLDSEQTMIEYYVMDDQTLAWVIEDDHFVMVPLTITRQTLVSQIDYLRDLIASREYDPDIFTELGNMIFTPLLPHIHHNRLIIVPHGVLHYLPFSALRDPQSQQYLVEQYTISIAPSASALKFLHAKATPNNHRLLAIGNPDGSLPYAVQEVEAITQQYSTNPVLGQQATESEFYRLIVDVDILHLAAHGRYEPLTPRFTRIELAPEIAKKDELPIHDGNLTVEEIYGLDLSEVNLVVLSACNSALGKQSRGDELEGLTRAFLYAGSPAVVTTLWSINDEASSVLMESFHRQLRAGMSNAEALRTAQVDVLRQDKWSSPYYWAAFMLTGDALGKSK